MPAEEQGPSFCTLNNNQRPGPDPPASAQRQTNPLRPPLSSLPPPVSSPAPFPVSPTWFPATSGISGVRARAFRCRERTPKRSMGKLRNPSLRAGEEARTEKSPRPGAENRHPPSGSACHCRIAWPVRRRVPPLSFPSHAQSSCPSVFPTGKKSMLPAGR